LDCQALYLLYWQGSLRKKAKETARDFIDSHKNFSYLENPETASIDLFSTPKKVGIILKKIQQD
jgi:hypothetical protein